MYWPGGKLSGSTSILIACGTIDPYEMRVAVKLEPSWNTTVLSINIWHTCYTIYIFTSHTQICIYAGIHICWRLRGTRLWASVCTCRVWCCDMYMSCLMLRMYTSTLMLRIYMSCLMQWVLWYVHCDMYNIQYYMSTYFASLIIHIMYISCVILWDI